MCNKETKQTNNSKHQPVTNAAHDDNKISSGLTRALRQKSAHLILLGKRLSRPRVISQYKGTGDPDDPSMLPPLCD